MTKLTSLVPKLLQGDTGYRFDRIQVVEKGDCYITKNYSSVSNGYPRWKSLKTGKMSTIQRDIYEVFNDESIPDDQVVVRACGHKNCCNPIHLELRDKESVKA